MTANGHSTGAQSQEPFDPLSPTMADAWMDRSAELRERCPVAWSDAHGGFWVFSRHDDVYGAALNWQLYSSAQGAVPVQYDLDVIRLIPLETDPPMHRNIRRVLNPFFAPEALKPAEGPIEDLVGELLDRCLATSPCDFVQEFASPLPSRVFFRFFLRHDEGSRIPWVLDILDTLFTRPDLAEEKAAELGGWCASMLAARRDQGHEDDLIGTIAHMGLDDDGGFQLSERERIETLYLTITAGMETTASALGNIGYHLATRPALRLQLRDMTSDELDHAVDELLRFEGAVPTSARTLTADVELRGCPMKKGDRVLFNWLGANRDPDTFTDPDVIDFARPNAARHVAFGAGPHHCLGSHLARREIRLSLEAIALLERFDLVPGTDVRFKPAFARGPKALPLIFAR